MAIVPSPKQGLSVVQDGRSYLDNLANKYIVKPKFAKGIGGFVFDYQAEETARLHADITDHFAEDNSVINDHIAKHPLRMTFRGYIGELVLHPPTGLLGAIQAVQGKLTTVTAYLGKYTPQALTTVTKALTQTTKVVNQVDQALARAKNIVGFFGNSANGKTLQEKAYQKLQSLWATNQVMIVETPFGMFGNMAIEDLTFTQPEETPSYTDIVVTLKGLRFVEVETSTIDFRSGRNAQQASPVVDKGSTKGVPEPSYLDQMMFNGK